MTNKYGVFLKPISLDRMVVVKTTLASPADADWDSQNGEVDFKLSAVKSIWSIEDGADIHIATQEENGRVAYHRFDPGTDTWTTKNELIAEAGDTNFDNAPANAAVSLALRADGDIIVIAAYNDGTNERLRVFSEQGGGWINEGEASGGVASTDYAGVVVIERASDDRISWAFKDTTNDDVDLRSISSTNVISVVTEIDPAADTATLIVAPGVIDNANKIYVPYIDADDQLSIASWPSGATPTVTLDTTLTARTVFGQGRTSPGYAAACMALDGTTDVHLVFYGAADTDIYHENDVDGAVGSDTKIEDLAPDTTIEDSLYAWGFNGVGELGDGTTTLRNSPVQIGILTDWKETANGADYSLAVKKDGSLWAWGRAANGRLGNGTVSPNLSSPVQIGALLTWATVSAGTDHGLAVKDDGTLWAWGNNGAGELGDGTTTERTSPVQIGAETNWASVYGGSNFSLALKADGSLWAWGSNASGQLGDGTVVSKSSPVQIGALLDWVVIGISHGAFTVHAVKSDNTLWSWGSGLSGHLGDGTTANKSSPVQIGSETTWATVSAGTSHSHAIKLNGSLWAWGAAASGRLGNGTTTPNLSSPVQIGSRLDWDPTAHSIRAGTIHTHAIKKDGTLHAWGSAGSGRLGNGTVSPNISSPVQIGALTNWKRVSVGDVVSLALKKAPTDFSLSARVIA